ncbi:MAG TPA: alpha/beta-hydrolase family protein [Actinomycetes bacterium]|nr:alpha/beta-hydrolase family protein [Actinomycetes bacterium]
MAAQGDETPTTTADGVGEARPKAEDARAQHEPAPTPGTGRRRFRYTLPGAWVALVSACLAFTPSLLPRGALLQGVVCGISAAIGYGLGVAGAWTWRAFADRDPRPPRPGAWRVFAISAAVLLAVASGLGLWWQAQLRDLMGAPTPSILLLPLLPLAAVGIFAGLVAVSRWLRGIYRRTAGRLERWMGRRAANALGWLIVVVATYLVASGLLLNGLAALADRSFSVRNTATAEGIERPTSPLRSGGPGSLVSWESLGRQGRTFTGSGPSAKAITEWTGADAQEPIRAYAGTVSAADVEKRAELAAADLERAGGFDRANLLVATTTGSGWLDSGATDSFEYLTGGDSAIVAMQYSYLPSWLSYLVDQKKAREAGRQLFDAVYDRWSKLPPTDRPRLFVFGLSLGSFGGETAFSGEYDLRNRTAGALFAGPPNFNTLYREFTDGRDPGSREVEPVYKGGRTVRFTNDVAGGIAPTSTAWNGTRVLYLQHPSDPIVWWSPRLIWDRPDWLGEPPGRDVLDAMFWMPVVTFWQVTVDLPLATGVPDGHGHVYTREFVDGWARVLQPAGWTADKAERLRDIVSAPE